MRVVRDEFVVEKEFRFEAAHLLVGHDGKCGRLHGHSFRATVRCRGEELVREGPKAAMLVDFERMSECVRPLVEEFLDHRFLNESLETDRPTSEFVARWLFHALAKTCLGDLLHSVTVEETCSARATYSLVDDDSPEKFAALAERAVLEALGKRERKGREEERPTWGVDRISPAEGTPVPVVYGKDAAGNPVPSGVAGSTPDLGSGSAGSTPASGTTLAEPAPKMRVGRPGTSALGRIVAVREGSLVVRWDGIETLETVKREAWGVRLIPAPAKEGSE